MPDVELVGEPFRHVQHLNDLAMSTRCFTWVDEGREMAVYDRKAGKAVVHGHGFFEAQEH